jgi:hypothetical protein
MTQDNLAFGVTIDQIDHLNNLLRTITANGDVITVGCEEPLHPQTVSALRQKGPKRGRRELNHPQSS